MHHKVLNSFLPRALTENEIKSLSTVKKFDLLEAINFMAEMVTHGVYSLCWATEDLVIAIESEAGSSLWRKIIWSTTEFMLIE